MARKPILTCPFCGNPTPKKNIVEIGYNEYVCKDCVDYVNIEGQHIGDYFFEDEKREETLWMIDDSRYLLIVEKGEEIKNYKLTKESALCWCIELNQLYALERFFPEYER